MTTGRTGPEELDDLQVESEELPVDTIPSPPQERGDMAEERDGEGPESETIPAPPPTRSGTYLATRNKRNSSAPTVPAEAFEDVPSVRIPPLRPFQLKAQ